MFNNITVLLNFCSNSFSLGEHKILKSILQTPNLGCSVHKKREKENEKIKQLSTEFVLF